MADIIAGGIFFVMETSVAITLAALAYYAVKELVFGE